MGSLSQRPARPTDTAPPNKASMWARPVRLLSQMAVLLLLLAITTDRVTSSPQPGHLVHDFYKCSSKFYYDFSRCKMEREEAARRGLNLDRDRFTTILLQLAKPPLFSLRLLPFGPRACASDSLLTEGYIEWGGSVCKVMRMS